MSTATNMSTITKRSTDTKHESPDRSLRATAVRRVEAEIESMLQINGNTPAAQGWVPRVVMMAYERRCAGNPADVELAECFSVAQAIASRS